MYRSYTRIIKIFESIKTERIKDIGRITRKSFTRDRELGFEDLMLCILNKRGLTLTMEIDNYFEKTNQWERAITKQAFSKQRYNLNPEVFTVLNQDYIKSIYEQTNIKRFHKYILVGIDGSVQELPNCENLKGEFGGITNKHKEVIVARGQASGAYDCLNNVMINCKIDKYEKSEINLAKENINETLKVLKKEEIIFIFDRGYPSIEFIYYLNKLGVKYLFRIKTDSYKNEKNKMLTNDEEIELKITAGRVQWVQDENLKEKLKALKQLKVRMTKVKLSTGEEEHLISNLDTNEVKTFEMKELYFKRWNIEKAYDVLKNKLYIENISGKSRQMVEQDFYSQILLYNMLEDIRTDANENLELKTDNKYDYQVNMNVLIGLFRNKLIDIAIEKDDIKRERLYMALLDKIKKNLVAIKPNRSSPRNKKNTINKYTTNLRRNS